MGADPKQPTDRQARALIVAAEALGFRREPDLIFWEYDDSLLADAERAQAFLATSHPDVLNSALSAPDPIPTWAAIKRIEDKGGLNGEQVRVLIEAALARGFDVPEPELPGIAPEWDRARDALAALWEHDPQAIPQLLGERQGRIAPLPESAVTRCPSCCDHGWVLHRFAGPVQDEEPEWWPE